MTKKIITLLLIVLMASCQQQNPQEEMQTKIADLEKNLNSNGAFQKSVATSAIEAYQGYVSQFPEDSMSAIYRYRIAETHQKADDLGKAIETYEAILYEKGKETNFDIKAAMGTVRAYEAFAKKNVTDAQTPEYLFKAAEIQRSLKNYKKAIENYETIQAKHPDYAKTPHSMFLLGFIYENDLKDSDKAKALYEQFLERYPEHELADDVKFSLDNLGISPEDIIKGFEEKNKKEGAK
ncbi:MAG: tetratricopeptide repeat protein [Chitinophagales bacterium]